MKPFIDRNKGRLVQEGLNHVSDLRGTNVAKELIKKALISDGAP
ncbi:hypothetical protein Mcup_1314 [Metallosphaera cuprina Ar-4]|uniref:Uncharacterized protein n=1 Tax=Metallosphaera cuprina (strain Ar-4) TaxID=1006006 RepID=F4FY44_METCR|nr:hypothetical protein Mcup_1314 [Metallosphaera cuprina Ar-4]